MEHILVSVYFRIGCTNGMEFNANVHVLEEVIEDYDDDVDQRVCCECLYEEEAYNICNHVYEYQQMQMIETKEHIDNDAERYQESNANKQDGEEHIDEMLIHDAETIKEFVRADDNSSRSNASSIIAQDEMKSDKAEAGLKAFKNYDYRIECEGKMPGSVDPIRLYFQKKRMQSILAVSQRRKVSSHMSELLTARLQHIHTTADSECHVIA